MHIAVDLHIHSRFSRATSRDLTLPTLELFARRKGVKVLGTGDFTHPQWRKEMSEQLDEDGSGLLTLKPEFQRDPQEDSSSSQQMELFGHSLDRQVQESDYHVEQVKFQLTTELSTIYKHNGKTRKIHHVFLAPSLEAVEKISEQLVERKVNIFSDGRPIMGLTSEDLCELIFGVDERCQLIPAHIWTPWFAVLGSKGGYDSLEECYGKYTDRILALETGLSSDPAMNWRLSALDRFTLVSHSDAHSPRKIARESNILQWDPQQPLTYDWVVDTIRKGEKETFPYTIEFYPEEGKYHWDGHRTCGVQWKPSETLKHDGICTECGNEVTMGVEYRVEKLADRPEGHQLTHRPQPIHLVPLAEIISSVEGKGELTKHVQGIYQRLLGQLGSELFVLLKATQQQIAEHANERVAQGVANMREGKVKINPGYDGEFGLVKVAV